jgi:hypothetical protein
MVLVAWSSASLVAALVVSPSLPPDRAAATPEPATEPAQPDVPDAPTDPTLVDPTAEPTPEPTPEPVVTPVAAEDDEIAPRGGDHNDEDDDDDDDDDDEPIERFEAGQWGMQFTFGGLAPMSVGGLRDFGVNRLLFTELGFRRVVSDQWVIPFSIGAGVFNHNPDAGDTQNDVGLAASVGVQRYFRVWRRIAPYAGGRFRVDYSEPNGRSNWRVGVGFGPVLGIEYFVGHRVSLTMLGEMLVGINTFDGLRQVELATRLDAGGQMGLVFYF